MLRKLLGHLKTITHHRHLVMRNCFRAGIGLQGLKHDLSKYAWTEFIPGVRFYAGDHSPTESERKNTAIPPRGCTIRAATGTTSNIGRITFPR